MARLEAMGVVALEKMDSRSMIAEDMEQATEYKSILEANDISATITEPQAHEIGSKEIAVMVPEEFLDEAHVIIESQHAYDDFYDFAMDDDDDSDFGDDFFEEDF